MVCIEFRTLLAIALAALCAASASGAELYKWVDPQGKVQYTDRLPAEAVNRGNVEMSKQGVAKKVTEPTLTAEQRSAMEERILHQREADKAVLDRQHQENALLSSYTSESDIEVARRRNLAIVGAGILSAEARIKALQRRAAALEREKLFYEKKPFPEKLKRELASVQTEIPKQYAVISQKNEDALAVNERYDAQHRKFVEIKGRMATEAQSPQSSRIARRP